MKVREFMELWVDNVDLKVYQEPIKQIDKNVRLVLRQIGSVNVLLDSNQNYLDFDIVNLQYDDGFIIVVCRANKEQEQKTINAYRSLTL